MKKALLIILMTFAASVMYAQIPPLAWAKQFGGTGARVSSRAIATDHSGNVYTTGDFGFSNATVDFDPGTGTSNFTCPYAGDVFVSKLDASGNFVWAKQFTGLQAEGISIALDDSGNVYVAGVMWEQVDFDPGPGVFNLGCIPTPCTDAYVFKLNSSGDFQWAVLGGVSASIGGGITLDAARNVYYFIYAFGGSYLRKLDGITGSTLWSQPFLYGGEISIGSLGDIYISGTFSGTVDFDPGTNVVNLPSAGSDDIFVLKLNASGNFIWVKQMGGASSDRGGSIGLDASDNIYTAGTFQGTADFDPRTPVFNLISSGNEDMYISKLDSSGGFIWAKQMGGDSSETISSLVVDRSTNIYTTGAFKGTPDFDPGAGTFTLTSAGVEDIFISKLDTSGNFIWAAQFGGTALNVGNGVTADTSGNVYATGDFIGTADFNPAAGVTNLTALGFIDSYVLKLGQVNTSIHIINSENQDMKVYPNPALDHLCVSFSVSEKENYFIKLFDVTGLLVYSRHGKALTERSSIDINTSNLPGGIYSLQFVTDEKTEQTKIVLQ